MKGGYTDNYYMQMAQNIRRYKGVRPIPELHGHAPRSRSTAISRTGSRSKVEYRDTVGDTFHRDYNGYGGLHYTNDSGRNDIVTSKVAVDREDGLLLRARRTTPLTPHTGTNWMLLLIDADQNPKTGWYGYDYLINQRVVDAKTTTIMRYDSDAPDDPWVEAAQAELPLLGQGAGAGRAAQAPRACRATHSPSISTGATIRPI